MPSDGGAGASTKLVRYHDVVYSRRAVRTARSAESPPTCATARWTSAAASWATVTRGAMMNESAIAAKRARTTANNIGVGFGAVLGGEQSSSSLRRGRPK